MLAISMNGMAQTTGIIVERNNNGTISSVKYPREDKSEAVPENATMFFSNVLKVRNDTAGSGYIVTWPPDKRIVTSNGGDSFWNQDFPGKIWKSRNKFLRPCGSKRQSRARIFAGENNMKIALA